MKLTIIVPVFNEEKTVAQVIKGLQKLDLRQLGLRKEIVVVDDGSTDRSSRIIGGLKGIKFLRHGQNQGKGAAVRTALANSSGEVVVIQDADLEYDLKDLPKVLAPIVQGKTDVVFGSRFKGRIRGKILFWHQIGNKVLSLATALLFSTGISDMETGYKAFKRSVLKGVSMRSRGFDFEPEITAKILKRGCRILEVPITYNARTFAEGKKITAKDGIIALATLFRCRFFG